MVETKDKGGWVFGSEKESFWTQTFPGNTFKFQNPLRQNHRHIMSLCGLLGLNESIFHSLVVFWGAEFKKTMSDNVVKNPLEYNNFIKRKKDILLIQDQVDAARRYLTDLKNTTTSADHRKHVETLKQKHNCPECGGKLVEKTARTGQYAGKKITCCSNFPKCRYLKYH